MRSQSTSSTPRADEGVTSADFPIWDVMVAKVIVKRLVGSGERKGPSDLLILPEHQVEMWYNEEAVRYLKEQQAVRRQTVADIN